MFFFCGAQIVPLQYLSFMKGKQRLEVIPDYCATQNPHFMRLSVQHFVPKGAQEGRIKRPGKTKKTVRLVHYENCFTIASFLLFEKAQFSILDLILVRKAIMEKKPNELKYLFSISKFDLLSKIFNRYCTLLNVHFCLDITTLFCEEFANLLFIDEIYSSNFKEYP